MGTVPNGINPNSRLKSLKNYCGQDTLSSCILSASVMDTVKSRIVRLPKSTVDALIKRYFPHDTGQTSALLTSALCSACRSDCLSTWIQCLWVFSQESQDVVFVTKLQWKLLSNSYINTYLPQDQYCCSSIHLNNSHYIQARKHQLGYRICKLQLT